MSVGVVVMSYNRPRWLGEALRSIKGAAQIVIADDASDFDPHEVAAAAEVKATVVRSEPVSLETRMTVPRQGRLINEALDMIEHDVVTYLCDDDLFAPGWIPAIEAFYENNPTAHMCRGNWNTLGTDESSFALNSEWVLTTGNFAHPMSCTDLEGCWWNEGSTAVQDALFLRDYLNRHNQGQHGGRKYPHLGVLAGWRREHPYNLARYTSGLNFGPGAARVLQGRWLEPEEVTA